MIGAEGSDRQRRYSLLADAHGRARAVEQARSRLISRLRLLTFLPALTLLVWTLARGVTPGPVLISLALFAVFGALVVWHARVEERVAWFDALSVVNARAMARLRRDWPHLPLGDAPPGVNVSGHAYAEDLDLFGRASLFQWLGPAATPGGDLTLARWLLGPAPADEIAERQRATGALAPLDVWREELAAHGVLADSARASQRPQNARRPHETPRRALDARWGPGETEIDSFVQWAEASDAFGQQGRLIRATAFVILVLLWITIGLHAVGGIAVALWLLPLLATIVLSFALGGQVQTALNRAGSGQQALTRYAGLFEHAVAVPGDVERLRQIRQRMSAEGASAPQCMRRLNRLLGFGELRRGAAILHFPIQALTLWDFHVVFALDRWRRHVGQYVRGWLGALGELDALAVLAGARRDNADWATPSFVSKPVLQAAALGHPLIPDDRRVANDVTVGPPGSLVLVTGSNMSGKSTLLRSIGLNVVLAQAGGCVCAASLELPACDLQTSIRVQDSLELGLSSFMAALARLKGVVDSAEHEREGRVLLYLLDEILQGTNSVERSIAVRAVARHLLDAGAIGAMTTHDLTLADAEPIKSGAHLVHFSESVDESGTMHFDYRLRPGLATSRNALRLMQMIGIDV